MIENSNCKEKTNNKLQLGKIYIEEQNGETVKLCSKLKLNNEEIDVFYFEVDKKWSQYLVTEYSDAFVLAVLKKALKHSYDIVFETPISEELYYGLTTYTIPIFARNIPIFNTIQLIGPTTQASIKSGKAVGTGFSAGVDSFYSVLKHLSSEVPDGYNLTHLVLTINGSSSTGLSKELDEIWYNSSMKRLTPYAEKLGLEIVGIKGNLDLLYTNDTAFNGDTIMTSSYIHALRKLFGVYYWGSTYAAEIFGFPDVNDAGYWENLTVPYVSVSGLRFYHSGSETDRIGKIKYICSNDIVKKGLTVCGSPSAKNCGRCIKCLRTMSELNALGVLREFSEVFPVDDFYKNYTSRLAEEIEVDHSPFNTDILKEMKKNGIEIPLIVYFKAFLVYKPLKYIRGKSKVYKSVRRYFYSSGLYKKYGNKNLEQEDVELILSGIEKK